MRIISKYGLIRDLDTHRRSRNVILVLPRRYSNPAWEPTSGTEVNTEKRTGLEVFRKYDGHLEQELSEAKQLSNALHKQLIDAEAALRDLQKRAFEASKPVSYEELLAFQEEFGTK